MTDWDRSHGLRALSRVWQHVKLSEVSLETQPWYSLVVDEDFKFCLVGWFLNVLVNNFAISRTGLKTESLTILHAATHETEREATLLVGRERPQRESNPWPPHQESRALPTELLPPPAPPRTLGNKTHKQILWKIGFRLVNRTNQPIDQSMNKSINRSICASHVQQPRLQHQQQQRSHRQRQQQLQLQQQPLRDLG